MTQRIFGTDGVRGLANGVITAELAVDLGAAAARVLVDHGGFSGQRPVAVVGRDTRISGQFLEHAVVAGLASAGVDVIRLRVLPTPGVAYLTDALGADVGVVISASHNPMPDNGIKFLARGGVKLDDALEREIEALVGEPWDRPVGGEVGRVTPYARSVEEYSDHLVGTSRPPADRAPGRPRLCQRRRLRGRAPHPALGRGGRDRPQRRPRRAQHQRAAAGRRISRRSREAVLARGADWASPSTAMPTAAWRSTTPERRWTATS